MKEKIEQLNKLKEDAKLGGGEARIKAQHDKGKLTARERIELLVDEGSFEEIDTLSTERMILVWISKTTLAMVLLQDSQKLMEDRWPYSARILPYLEVHFRKPTQKK